jgi:hypothetical protein
MLRIAILLSAGMSAGCVVLPLPGYGGIIYLPQGRVELPRELTLEACAAAVRAATPEPLSGLGGDILGVCAAPDGARHLVRPGDIQPGVPDPG